MGETCHQARVYQEILAGFAEAIHKYRQKISLESRRTVQHYMDQVLVIDMASQSQAFEVGFEVPGGLSAEPVQHDGFVDSQMDMMLDEFQLDWAEFDLQSLDELYSDFGPLKGLLCSVE